MAKEKKPRRSEEEKRQIVAKFKGINDVFFELLIEDPGLCEEFLQTILEKPDLRIIPETLTPQKDVKFLVNRSIRVDAYVESAKDVVFNIEVQRSDNCNHVKRVRYNASAITVSRSEPGDEFEHVQELYVVYVSEADILGGGKTVYHAEMTVKETGEVLNDGLHEIYVNTACNDGSKIARLMAHFQETEVDDPEFPNYSRKMYSLKHDPKEVERVCKLVQDYAEDYAKEYAKEYAKDYAKDYARKEIMRNYFDMVQEGDMTPERAAERLHIQLADFLDEMQAEGYKVPALA